MLPLEAWLLVFFSILLFIISLIRFDWARQAPVYFLFLLLTGLLNTWITHILVLGGYLEFPWRLFPKWTLNNVVYDLWLLPAFTLLLVEYAKKASRPWLTMTFQIVWVLIQDLLIDRYTELMEVKKWTWMHSTISAGLYFWVCYFLLQWLCKHFTPNRSQNK